MIDLSCDFGCRKRAGYQKGSKGSKGEGRGRSERGQDSLFGLLADATNPRSAPKTNCRFLSETLYRENDSFIVTKRTASFQRFSLGFQFRFCQRLIDTLSPRQGIYASARLTKTAVSVPDSATNNRVNPHAMLRSFDSIGW